MGRYRIKEFSRTADQISETATLVESAITLNGDFPWISFTITSSGGSVIALDVLNLQIQMAQDGDWNTIVTSWSQSTGLQNIISVAMETLAHGTSGIGGGIYIGSAYAIRFLSAQAGSTASAVTILIEGIATQNG